MPQRQPLEILKSDIATAEKVFLYAAIDYNRFKYFTLSRLAPIIPLLF